MPSAGLTELEAVNSMLGLIGEAPIDSLDGDLTADAALAQLILSETSRQIQETGYHFNTDFNYRLSPTVDGYIAVPSDAISVDSDWYDITVRSGKLYNKETNTDIFSSYVDCTIVRYMAWDDIPAPVRRYITARATTKFATRTLGSSEIVKMAQMEEFQAAALFQSYELDDADHSMLDNWEVARAVQRRV